MPSTTTNPSVPSPSRPPQGLSGRILYAEDLHELRELMRFIAEAEGHAIETANDGDEALQRLTHSPTAFDLLITDHHMPRMNGLELVNCLVKTNYHGKIMVFSSELGPAICREYHRAGVAMILPKPSRPTILRRMLTELLPAR